eukprot:TRINITY_DN3782_c0_g2_i1.p1 TRINITY_DN3782_c0_g2~~TRINITY_DN3782_c0_g2_i1.p1  ORF type:complete len:238 (+),score=42.07 TRINITY_DN3782_c0_g2_i1:81-794(+)
MSEKVTCSIRDAFSQLDAMVKDASTNKAEEDANRELLLKEFADFFGVEVNGGKGVTGGKALKWTKESSTGWVLNNQGTTVTMSACGGWRTLITDSPLEGDEVYCTVQVHALRTLAVGISQGSEPAAYVGDSSGSWAYQSTGHTINTGSVLEGRKVPEFTKGDTIGILLDRKQRYIAFYKNGQMAGVPFTDLKVDEPFKLAVSCYMGPCSVSVNLSPLGKKPMQNIMRFPICIEEGCS